MPAADQPGDGDGTIRGEATTRARATLVSIAVVSALLCGCGPGKATAGSGPASAANPRLHGTGAPQPVPGSAAGVARVIAARWAATGAPAPALNTPIEWRTIDYTATVFNPGAPGGFTAFITTRRTILATPASAATIDASNGAPARFATPADQTLWQAAGRPTLGQAPAGGQTQTIPAGQFTFLPQGATLTYWQAAALPLANSRHPQVMARDVISTSPRVGATTTSVARSFQPTVFKTVREPPSAALTWTFSVSTFRVMQDHPETYAVRPGVVDASPAWLRR